MQKLKKENPKRYAGHPKAKLLHKAIIYAWVNDETSLRKAGSRINPYVIFNKRLRDGDPPDGWNDALRKAKTARIGFGRRFRQDQGA